MALPLASQDWLSFAEAEALALNEPALAHATTGEIFTALDWLGDTQCEDEGYVATGPYGLLYAREAMYWLAYELGHLCALCGTVSREQRSINPMFFRWVVSTPFHVTPCCSSCASSLNIFEISLRGNVHPRCISTEAEFVAALHAITRAAKFKHRVAASADVWANLRFDPRRAPQQRAAA